MLLSRLEDQLAKNVVKKDAKVGKEATSRQQSKKKSAANPSKESKSQFTHSWLLTTLKGHTGSVLDMDFSPNDKHLATCCEGNFHSAFFVYNVPQVFFLLQCHDHVHVHQKPTKSMMCLCPS